MLDCSATDSFGSLVAGEAIIDHSMARFGHGANDNMRNMALAWPSACHVEVDAGRPTSVESCLPVLLSVGDVQHHRDDLQHIIGIVFDIVWRRTVLRIPLTARPIQMLRLTPLGQLQTTPAALNISILDGSLCWRLLRARNWRLILSMSQGVFSYFIFNTSGPSETEIARSAPEISRGH